MELGSVVDSNLSSCGLQELVEDFVFTASKVLLQCRKNQGDIQQLDQVVPVCSSPATIMATFELLISLVTGCLSNLRALSDMITAMFYSSGPQQHNSFFHRYFCYCIGV